MHDTNEVSDTSFRTDKVRPSKEHNNWRITETRTHSRWNSEQPKLGYNTLKGRITHKCRMALEHKPKAKAT
jgi:hypothetical protein